MTNNDLYSQNPADLFPSKYLKASDINGADMVVTIQSLSQEELGPQKDLKTVVYFAETDKGLVLNKTNTEVIADLYPGKIGNWVGKKIALYTTEVTFAGKTTLGVRVRLRKPEESASENVTAAAVPEAPQAWVE